MYETRLTFKHAGPRTTVSINRAVQHERKLLIEGAMLIRHLVANYPAPEYVQSLTHTEMSLQFFTDEKTTPIEDNVTPWPLLETPVAPVGRLTLVQADVPVENLSFDPWGGLEDHRPLGEVMRARKSAYHLSAKARRPA